MSSSKVIAVDLDGTLTLTDTLHEAVLALVRIKPFMLLLLPFWLIRGVAHLKLQVAENSVLDVTILPYNVPFINWLKEQKVKGKKIVLCTAANEVIAQAVSKHLGFFDDVIAAGIFHTDPVSAAAFLSHVVDDPNLWWQGASVQAARRDFVKQNFGEPEELDRRLIAFSNEKLG